VLAIEVCVNAIFVEDNCKISFLELNERLILHRHCLLVFCFKFLFHVFSRWALVTFCRLEIITISVLNFLVYDVHFDI